MSAEERLAHWTPAALIELIVKRSEEFGQVAGVGGMETAGALVSYLAEHPNDLEPWIVGGFLELPPDWIEHGRLTWHAQKGARVVSPRYARQHRTIKRLEKSA